MIFECQKIQMILDKQFFELVRGSNTHPVINGH